MHDKTSSGRRADARDPVGWHLLLIIGVSAAYESLFIHHGIAWLFDEGWPLYAAMRLHAGGVLYQDVFFVFPPGHLLSAWIAYAADPPGIVLARIFYGCFNVALCVAMYLLARKIMRPSFALLGVLMVAIAAPRSHVTHLVFGYRYLVFSVLVLLAFAQRLKLSPEDTKRAFRWMLVAGALAGVALVFRLTPAFAVSCAIGVGVLVASNDWRTWMRDWASYALGLGLVAVPVLAWLAQSVGLEVVWREVVVRPIVMTDVQDLQSIPFTLLPEGGTRRDIFRWFIALQHNGFGLMYTGYVIGLTGLWLRSLRSHRRFEGALLLAVATWGGIYLLRSLGRSDDHHVMTALPPAFILLAHGLGVLSRRVGARTRASHAVRLVGTGLLAALVLGSSAYAQRLDLYLTGSALGEVPLASTGGVIRVTSKKVARRTDRVVHVIQRLTREGDVVLDLAGAPLFHVLTGRFGPGTSDVVTPGIFITPDEEHRFVEGLALRPPRAIIWPRFDFDGMPERSITVAAPQLAAWVRANYRTEIVIEPYEILVPGEGAESPR